jgi:hypothetical protein
VAAMIADGTAPEGAAAFAPERFLRAGESV